MNELSSTRTREDNDDMLDDSESEHRENEVTSRGKKNEVGSEVITSNEVLSSNASENEVKSHDLGQEVNTKGKKHEVEAKGKEE